MTFTTRFAPSPTGPLHLGHAYSALLAHDMAHAAGGIFHLRIEDLDQSRARPHWEAQIADDLHWLGLTWPEPAMRQSDRGAAYAQALAQFEARGLLYPCRCNRADIDAAAGAPQEGVPQFGPDGRIYPGTCRNRPMADRQPEDVIRLNIARATEALPALTFTETGAAFAGTHALNADDLQTTIGDVILERRQMAGSYHLAVTVDDAAQAITHVIRGEDLFDATRIHVLLQHLLGLPTPTYHHHRLIRDDAGKRLAKRDDARAIARYREDGLSPADIRKLVGL
ncbi:tRNA glutamyl-Q(34) synthetase GluQRS [Chachezhania antarctica]|uniref:tRNA glutamyl-Q(34) synthetase GluQRS n=1 Tax=Chachezhania antarctica TaxID=2340860 RepID=UPI000EB5CC10|nr:tRNA glutamyl-Q(34) synthetase GluQRS [Chachezhania antarctica]